MENIVQKEFIESCANSYLNKIIDKLNDNHQEFLDNISNRVLLDISNKITSNVESEYTVISNSNNCLMEYIELNEGEHVIFDLENYYYTYTSSTNYNMYYKIYYESLIVTNFSNMYNSGFYVSDNKSAFGGLRKQTIKDSLNISKTINNIILDPILINIIQSLTFAQIARPKIKLTGNYNIFSDLGKIKENVESRSNINPSKYYNDTLGIIGTILKINEDNYYKFLSTTNLTQKYEASLLQIQDYQGEIERQQLEIDKLKRKLADAVPIDNQCCICYGYTEKHKACVPCGHRQYCDDCIESITQCSICRAEVQQVNKNYI